MKRVTTAAAASFMPSPTLDALHAANVTSLRAESAKDVDLQRRLDVARSTVASLDKLPGPLTELQIGELNDAKDAVADLVCELQRTIRGADTYWTATSKILFEYYDADAKAAAALPCHAGILRHFLPAPTVAAPAKTDLMDTYLTAVDACHVSMAARNPAPTRCKSCGGGEMSVRQADCFLVCDACDCIQCPVIDEGKPSYKDPPKDVYFAYKRMNHLTECLNQVQAKETTDIPESVYDRILDELKKQNVTDVRKLTPGKLQEIMKKLYANKYYEHTYFILNRLTGLPIHQLPREVEDLMKSLFSQVLPKFNLMKDPDRKNFLAYNYTLYKIVQLLGHDEFLPKFKLLKDRDKLIAQDRLWAKICKSLSWQFLPSV